MTSEAATLSQNSTNVRVYTIYQSLHRLGFRLFGTLFPRTAARWFERVLLTPRRKPAPFDATASLLTGEISRVPYGSGWLNVWSAGEGPTVLLLHGWSGQAAHLDCFIDPLLTAGFRVVAFDAPGHGASAGKMTNIVECIGATLQVARSAGPIHGMIAHSFGTALATFAVKYGVEVDRMVFLAPPLSITAQSHSIGELIGLPRRVSDLVQRRVERRLHIKWEDFDTDKAVADSDVPLLVVHDQEDRKVSWRDGEAIARAAKNGRLVTTSGLGHRMILRDERVIDQAVDFLSGRMGAFQDL